MKKTIITLLIFCSLGATAQLNIAPIEDLFKVPGNPNTYYKDINHEFDKYVGEWEFESAGTILRLKFTKLTQVSVGNSLSDALAGEYEYIENGNTLISTYPLNIGIPFYQHNIFGSKLIRSQGWPECSTCGTEERRVRLSFNDPTRPHLITTAMILQFLSGDTPEKIKAIIIADGSGILENDLTPTETTIPFGEYILTKQQ